MNIWDRVQNVINQGVETSKDLLEKAKDKAQELGEKGMLKFEIMQLENQTQKCLLELGSRTFGAFTKDEKDSLSKTDATITKLVEEITDLQKKIDEKEEKMKSIK